MSRYPITKETTMKNAQNKSRAAASMLGKAVGAAAIAWVAMGSALANDANYPNKPITINVPFSAGGTTDILARAIGQRLGQKWGVSVVVENKPGAGGNIGTAQVARSTPDGYTL